MSKVVNGFLTTKGQRIIDSSGEEILLRGWGIGNWLLPEGYMWESRGSKRFDRPHRMEQVIIELLGERKAAEFWKKFYQNYITEADIRYIKQQGYNSIRLPINWPLFFENEPEVIFKEMGFEILDQVIAWCEANDLYLFIDLHGAPGGQTGANIDDSVDDIPRLFIDEDKWEKGLALWEEIARRYHDKEVVAGYDLLNEPIRPGSQTLKSYDHLVDKLSLFYDEAIKRIRKYDKNHIIALEGHHWATSTTVFNKKYDDNFVIHFHRYGNLPQQEAFQEFLELGERYNVPLWLGETGENTKDWFVAMVKLCEDYHISYHFWPYKKMGRKNCPVTIPTPKDWDQIIEYTKEGKHPGYEATAAIFAEFLENIKLENCQLNPEVDYVTLRKLPFTYRGTDFDITNYHGNNKENNFFNYRLNTGITILEDYPVGDKRFTFDNQWDRFFVELNPGEFVSYTVENIHEVSYFQITLRECAVNGEVEISQGGERRIFSITDAIHNKITTPLLKTGPLTITVKCISGKAQFTEIGFLLNE